jgi:hypothetical protein
MNAPQPKPKPVQAPVAKAADTPVAAPVTEPKKIAWTPMTEAPKDGTYVYLDGDDNYEEWFFYRTREFFDGKWETTGWWRRRFGSKAPPDFEPKGFRRVSQGLK